MDDILRLLVTVAIYFVIFAVVGIVFYEIDKRFKAWLGRRDRPVRGATTPGGVRPPKPPTAAAGSGRRRRRG